MFEILKYMIAHEEQNSEETLKMLPAKGLEEIRKILHAVQKDMKKYQTGRYSKSKTSQLKQFLSALPDVASDLSSYIKTLIKSQIMIEFGLETVSNVIERLVQITTTIFDLFISLPDLISFPKIKEEGKLLSSQEVFIRLALDPKPLSEIITPEGYLRREGDEPLASYLGRNSIDHLSSEISLVPSEPDVDCAQGSSSNASSCRVDVKLLKDFRAKLYLLDHSFFLLEQVCEKAKNKENAKLYSIALKKQPANLKVFLLTWHEILGFRTPSYPLQPKKFIDFFAEIIQECELSIIQAALKQEGLTKLEDIIKNITILVKMESEYTAMDKHKKQLANAVFGQTASQIREIFSNKTKLTEQERQLARSAGYLFSQCSQLYRAYKNIDNTPDAEITRYKVAIQHFYNAIQRRPELALTDQQRKNVVYSCKGLAKLYSSSEEYFSQALEALSVTHHLGEGVFEQKLKQLLNTQLALVEDLEAWPVSSHDTMVSFQRYLKDPQPSLRCR